MKLIISGGGSGGHIFPAVAIADALKEVDSNIEIVFVGALGKMEMDKVPKAGYPIIGLPVAGFHRQRMWRNITFPFKLLSSMWKARSIIRRERPDAAIGVGGYASGPILKAANWAGVKTFVQEQNSYAGVTNKLLAKAAHKIYVAYESMDKFFPKEKLMLTGNPVRDLIANTELSKEEAKAQLGVSSFQKVVLISGGSLGASAINRAIAVMEEWIKVNDHVFFYWQVGKLYLEAYQEQSIAHLPNVKIVGFIDDMAAAYISADLVICRAGALTISELTTLGKAAILMPSPNVAEDHQTHNAKALAHKDAAVLITDDEASDKLESTLKHLLNDEERLKELGANARQLRKVNAAQVIAKDILQCLNHESI